MPAARQAAQARPPAAAENGASPGRQRGSGVGGERAEEAERGGSIPSAVRRPLDLARAVVSEGGRPDGDVAQLGITSARAPEDERVGGAQLEPGAGSSSSPASSTGSASGGGASMAMTNA
jgi:hypothetical protein